MRLGHMKGGDVRSHHRLIDPYGDGIAQRDERAWCGIHAPVGRWVDGDGGLPQCRRCFSPPPTPEEPEA